MIAYWHHNVVRLSAHL